MRILVIANTAPKLNMQHIVTDAHLDMIMTLGDLTFADLVMLGFITNVPKIGISGEEEKTDYFEKLSIVNVDMKSDSSSGMTVIGVSASSKSKLLSQLGSSDIVIAHNPPSGFIDDSAGSDQLQQYIKTHKPKIVLYGHSSTLSQNTTTTIDETRIEYVHDHIIVTL